MTKATGIDVSDYDGSIINIYNENSFIGNHPDIDESKTAEKYPVVVVNIGGPGNIKLGTNAKNVSIDLKSGAGYIFGHQGKNRTVPHSTYAAPIKGTLPAITTKIDGETIPAGSYRISITMRRVMPLEAGMPSEPAVVSSTTQPSTNVTETKPTINLNVLLEELRDLEERKFKLSLKNETTEDNFIINNWIKVTPESVKEDTGVKTGSGKDVSTSLLSKNGLTIDAAAEKLGENFGYERGFSDQDIKNIIIDVLLAGSISTYLTIDKNAAGMQEINRRIKEITTQLETVKSTSLAAHTGLSGAAPGADTVWNKKGKEFGITKFIDYKVDTLKQLTQPQKVKLETAYQQAVKDLGRKALPYDWLNPDLKDRNGKLMYYSGGLVRRDYIQAALSDGIFAISDIILPGEKGKAVNEIRYPNKMTKAIVDGGTGYAVQMGINLNKPVYVFHQGTNADNTTPVGWYKWDGANFIAIKTPILTTKFAGIGTRKINEAGKQAIDDVYQETFTNLADHPFKGCEI
jgi:hypothetical protein